MARYNSPGLIQVIWKPQDPKSIWRVIKTIFESKLFTVGVLTYAVTTANISALWKKKQHFFKSVWDIGLVEISPYIWSHFCFCFFRF